MKTAPYIAIAALALLLLYALWRWDKSRDQSTHAAARVIAEERLRHRAERDSTLASHAFLNAQADSNLAERERQRDSANASWKPADQRNLENVAHFDTAGLGAAFDSLNLQPIAY